MAKSQPAPIELRPGRALNPFARRRVSVAFDPKECRTHQSFRDECDINQILAQFGRTGVMPSVARGRPQYGEVPDIDFHAAMCAQAAIATYEHDRPEGDPEPPEGAQEPETGSAIETAEKPLQAASEAAQTATEA